MRRRSLRLLFPAVLTLLPVWAQSTITTVAGGGPPDGLQATTVGIAWINGIATDSSGNLYIPSPLGSRVFRVTPGGVTTTVAGNGSHGYSGDGGSATSAQLDFPYGIAVDAAGNLYIADTGNNRIRKVSGGVITTVAGNGTPGFSGDGGGATNAQLNQPWNVAVDSSGNLYIADLSNQRIRKVSAGVITTVAGTGTAGFFGDGGSATSAQINTPHGVGVDTAGNLYIADTSNNRVRRVSGGVITTVVGTGIAGYLGDGGQATTARISTPYGVRVDGNGNLYVADSGNNVVRKVTAGVINTVAGNSGFGFSGDGGPAINAQMEFPTDVAIDTSGNLFIADNNNQRVRKVTSSIISTVAGNGTNGQTGDGGAATLAQIALPHGLALDNAGNLYIGDTYDGTVRKVAGGVISTVAGKGGLGFSGDGGAATNALLNRPEQVAVDGSGSIYVADSFNHRVRRVSGGVITTVAGNGTAGFGGDGGSATSAQLNTPLGVAVDGSGNLYISDSSNNRIRKVSGGVITTIAGNGTAGYSGDGGSATSAQLATPGAIAVDSVGANLYIADSANNRIRRVSGGVITTVAGIGTAGYSGDGGLATSAQLSYPTAVILDNSGSLYIADVNNLRVRKVTSGIINTVAGNGARGFSGDGGPATGAKLAFPYGLAVDNGGNLYLADSANNRIRLVTGLVTCLPSVSPTADSFSTAGGTLTVTLTTGGTCGWTSSSNVGWITPNPPTSGTGSATVTFAVSANTGTSARSGSVTVAGLPVQVTQAGTACTFTISPNFSSPLAASSQSYSFSLTASGSSCAWTASASASWVHLVQTSGTGTTTINFSVDANPLAGISRTATITAGGQNLSIVQAPAQPPPCTFSLPQSTQSFLAAGGTGSAAVRAGGGCAWTAVSNSAWIHITGGASGSGNGTVSYSVDNFTGSIVRSGTLTIAGLTYTITQQPGSAYFCTASAMPPILRAQGRTELTSDIVLMCSGQLPPGGVTANVSLALNTTFSSRITDPVTGSTEALLLINEPATPALGTNAFRGRVAGYNVVSWQNIPLTGATAILRLTNVRADASLLGTGALTAAVSIQSTIPVPVSNALLTVGFVTPGVSFQRSPQPLPGPNPSTQALLPVSFQEGFASSFKIKVAANQNPSTPGLVYNSESGFVNTAVLGAGTGLASSGTLLRVAVSNVPAYMQVQFPASDFDGKTQLSGTQGNTATWEVVSANPVQLETLTFNLLVNAPATDQNLAQIQIAGVLAPPTTATGASATAPIPRFADPTATAPVVNLRATSALVPPGPSAPGRPRSASITPSAAGVVAGGNVTFGQTVLNDTDSAATNVVVRDNLPPGLILTGCSSSDGTPCSISGNSAQVSYSQMNPGETRTVTVISIVDPSMTEGTVLENDFTVSSDQAPLDVQNNMAGVAVVVTENPAAPTVAILSPADGASVSGSVQVTGWALDNANFVGTAIGSVQVLVDGIVQGNATYGQSSTACGTYPGRPGCPNVGYTYTLNTASFTPGPHQLTIKATDTDVAADSGSATITIQVGAPPVYMIGGHVALFGGGSVTSVLVTLSGSQSSSTAPDASGNYSFIVNLGGTYTVTPSLAGYTFAPASRTFNSLSGSQTANFSGSGVLQFYAIPPCRVADTRSFTGPPGPLGPPSLTAGAARSFPVLASACGIPASAVAYSLNVSAVPTTGYLQYATVWPSGQPMPVASTLNSWDGRIVANAAVIPAGTGGAISIFASDPTDVFFDINGYFAPPGAGSLAFYPMAPCRVADTRSFTGPPGPLGPPSMTAGSTRSFPVLSSACGIPASAVAYSLNMSAVPSTNFLGYLTTWATGRPQPIVSTLNSWTGTIVANAAVVPAGSGGAISIFVSDTTDVFFDINGYFAPPGAGGLQYHPVAPCRVADTRSFAGPPGPLGPPSMTAGSSRSFPVLSSACGVPAAAVAYALNVTAVPTAGYLQYLTTWGTGQPQPVASTLNSWTGTIVPNMALVPAGTGGAISIFVSNPTDVFFDINGYFAP